MANKGGKKSVKRKLDDNNHLNAAPQKNLTSFFKPVDKSQHAGMSNSPIGHAGMSSALIANSEMSVMKFGR